VGTGCGVPYWCPVSEVRCVGFLMLTPTLILPLKGLTGVGKVLEKV